MTNPITHYIGSFIDEFALSGVTDAVVCPGSRSTPLAVLAAAHPDIQVHIQIDERSAGFFALGLAKARQRPVMLICTSGTAAANFYPAVIEAHYSRVPLIVLTADRPHELREVGAPQAINQHFLFGNFVKFFTDSALPEENPQMLSYIRTLAGRAVSEAGKRPMGPVHINVPLREPLMPDLSAGPFERMRKGKHVSVTTGMQSADQDALCHITERLAGTERGMIVCGEIHGEAEKQQIIALAEMLQFPILADPLSNLRNGEHDKTLIIDAYDSFLKDEEIKEALRPDAVIRFGPMPVSKPLFLWLRDDPAIEQFIVDEDGGWRDPTQAGAHMIHCHPSVFLEAVRSAETGKRPSGWLEKWQFVNARFRSHLQAASMDDLSFEGNVYRQLQHLVPEGSSIFVGNSMPIRDVDTFFEKQDRSFRVYANRGANGIDGVVSSAMGLCEGTKAPVTLVIGDLSFYHDLNGLLAAKKLGIPLTVILINNDGGGIFSFLPQASDKTHFEELFGTPTGLDFRHAAALYGGTYTCPETWEAFKDAYQPQADKPGLHIIELKTDRTSRVQFHRDLLQAAVREVKKEWKL
ncbi:2-succinyl-5-enolpyruvyl-6-hydroxy-3-cyclohexene-1-carboxylic-acid synthase [Bacillus velezensis]|uniref:2-succinyl-5-enolpyruvyl-6-hydroxy-3- cyclohexene-1-carboxylic-acid synthase n=1 Tax=Bacillus velezensis TaxID=492670 RepID=UPI00098822E2|nr:2-succinyl-5-enolpyruvyl-6-hydroxy-3-cyclohexene-1-carboxylic-acid synthase [Bacillus velezensis]AQS45219.1 2-succinyl-5-enolpyruvyl-6-hydroxy-3-cyclohexene-1-carboxylic-acid synthase [Bacillus velezensis]QKF34554.1 2-succinyl-5-enolpyruvyl-6-hydroxy-3-cyclohexene-1-carboxylic-acid synthase [Bacillus velezensis]WNR82104.1 2-succinyl-5-enolpyruvyl-6-hydroxy-3-cyclohexene-1-carboxylic-acid synthase [Bacillus velezensis]GJJ26942.1 2-succinyl-5-enolpyruvyl-6-hydroxy-3-cyclohexene- 1-carboxylate 